jgi:hypothetical protein
MYYGLERRQSQQQPLPAPPCPQPLVAPQQPDCLTERLEMLSSPHEQDDLSPGVVECLPPEGSLLRSLCLFLSIPGH